MHLLIKLIHSNVYFAGIEFEEPYLSSLDKTWLYLNLKFCPCIRINSVWFYTFFCLYNHHKYFFIPRPLSFFNRTLSCKSNLARSKIKQAKHNKTKAAFNLRSDPILFFYVYAIRMSFYIILNYCISNSYNNQLLKKWYNSLVNFILRDISN